MPDIHIRRDHQLGLPKAREIAAQWARDAEARFDMSCTMNTGEDGDTLDFTRSGVSGQLVVAADHFELNAKLGFLLGAFSKSIEREIEKNLDELLAERGAAPPAEEKSAPPAAVNPTKKAPRKSR